jgi:hypothetical protein
VAAVEELRASAAVRAQLGQAARAEALARYTWERSAEPVLQAYETLTRKRTTSAAEPLPAIETS